MLLLITALGLGVTYAHATLETSEPAKDAVLNAAPSEVTLSFTEPVELRFSLFKVYPLAKEVDLGEDRAFLRLNGLAGALAKEVLEVQDDARADTAVLSEEARSETITLGLKEGLEPGAYTVMWRVLSVDTHTTQGQFVFVIDPENE